MQMLHNETKALYFNLKKLSKNIFCLVISMLQNMDMAGWRWRQSDVKSVTGSHPAVIGVDFSGFSGRPDSMN